MTRFPTVFLPHELSGSQPQVRAHLVAHGLTLVDDPVDADVVVATAGADRTAERGAGAGVVVLLGVAGTAGTVAADLLSAHGIQAHVDAARPVRGLVRGEQPAGASTAVDLLAWMDPPALAVGAALSVQGPAVAAVRAVDCVGDAHRHGSVVVALSEGGPAGRVPAEGAPTRGATEGDAASGRVVAIGLGIDGEAGAELLLNAVVWAARAAATDAVDPDETALARNPDWLRLKAAATELQSLQAADASVPEPDRVRGAELVLTVASAADRLAPALPHDADYLTALVKDLHRWVEDGLGVPDFLDSLVAFHPEQMRVDGLVHLVVFPMYTQNGRTERKLDAVLLRVLWPEFVAELEATAFSNALFVPITFIDFTSGYDTNAAVLFPETVATREVPVFTWGAIFADREAARFRRVVRTAADTCRLSLPPDAARLLDDQQLAQETFVLWDLIHDRTHMRGDLPFDPFMVKQRMPYFLYSLEELRCDLTAFRQAVRLEAEGVAHARLVQYAVVFDRIFRFAITGGRVRNYDGLGGQLLFAWLHQHRVLHWTDNRLTIDWPQVPAAVIALGDAIDDLYWRSIDRPKTVHWLEAYVLVAGTVTPHPASVWARGAEALPVDGPPKGLTDAVLPDEFPLSMFYEALNKKIGDVVSSTAGITG